MIHRALRALFCASAVVLIFVAGDAAFAGSCVVRASIELPPGCERPSHVVVFSTNDHHGSIAGKKIRTGAREGGLARQAAWIRDQIAKDRKELACPAHLLLSAGDIMSGDIASDVSDDRADFEAMDRMGFSAMALGNHDLDRGLGTLRKVVGELVRFPVLSANVSAPRGGACPFSRYALLTLRGDHPKGKKYVVAVAGLTTSNVDLPAEDKRKLVFKNPVEVATRLAPEIQRRHHPDAIILLSHLGGAEADRPDGKDASSGAVARRTGGAFDLIVDGHDHALLDKPVVVEAEGGRTLITEAGCNSRHVTKTVLPVQEGKRLGDGPATSFAQRMDASLEEDPSISAIWSRFAGDPRAKPYAEVVWKDNPVFFEGDPAVVRQHPTNASRFMADAYRSCCGDADLSVISPSSVRNSILPGEVTAGDIANVSPFLNANNAMALARLTGREVRELVDLAERRAREKGKPFLYFSPELARRKDGEVLLGGRLVEAGRTYVVAGIRYLFENVLERRSSFEPVMRGGGPLFAYDCMAEYARRFARERGEAALARSYRSGGGAPAEKRH